MRYQTNAKGENVTLLGDLTSGETATIEVTDLSDDSSVALDDDTCSEVGSTGVFKWSTSNFTTQPTTYKEYLYIMTDALGVTSKGKFAVGGYPDNCDDAVSDVTAKTDNLPASPAAASEYDAALAAIQSDLDNPGQYKADVSALALEANVQGHAADALTAYDPPTRTEATSDKNEIIALINRALGLMQENQYLDNTTYDSNNNLLSGRLRIYSDAASVGTVNNVLATYTITATYTNETLTTYKVVKV